MILLTGKPRIGKSTAIKKIINMLGINNCGGFYTEEIRDNIDRVGFKIKTMSGKEGILSHKDINSEYKISKYGVDINTFEELCINELLLAINNDKVKYIIIDEIGPMQLFSSKYKELLIKLLNSNKPVIGTIYMNNYDWLDDFKKMDNVNLIEVTLDNRNSIPLKIMEMVVTDESLLSKIAKAKKYSLEINRFKFLNDKIELQGEHGLRTVKIVNDKYICDCDYYKENGTCSHIIATININNKE